MTHPLDQDLSKLKIRTALDFPFFGTVGLLVTQQFMEDISAPAMTDGTTIYWSPEWWEKLSPSDRMFVHLHEISHICLLHPVIGKEIKDRLGERYDHAIAQEASDHAVNILLANSGYRLPEEIAFCDWQYEGMSFEEIYAKIAAERQPPEEPTEGDDDEEQYNDGDDQTSGSGGRQGQEGTANPAPSKGEQLARNPGAWEPGKTDDVTNKLAQQIEQIISQATQSNAGDIPVGLDRQLQWIKQRSIDWKSLLALALFNAGCSEYTWRRPHRALLQEDIIIPGTQDNEKGRLLFIVDTSGSMTEEQINGAIDYIEQLRLTFKNVRIETGSHDTEYYPGPTFDAGQPIDRDFKLKGGGGTRFAPTVNYINSQPPFDAVIWLTDGENFDNYHAITFRPEDKYIWLLTAENVAFREKNYQGQVCILR